MKKKNWIPGIILAAVLALPGCGGAAQANNADTGSSSDTQKSEEKIIKIGSPTTDGTQLVENAGLAYRLGYLDEELEKQGIRRSILGLHREEPRLMKHLHRGNWMLHL